MSTDLTISTQVSRAENKPHTLKYPIRSRVLLIFNEIIPSNRQVSVKTHRFMPIHAVTTVMCSNLAIGALSHRPEICPAGTNKSGSMAILHPLFFPLLKDMNDIRRMTRMIALHSNTIARLLFTHRCLFQCIVK